ncbi:hypothetical protein MKY91_03790 [Alkalicoccobacillus gibsonii]|uniref:Uncharacterized protein n=1 Tax=Alkalicoccobacillus gibsonii TaxID=79881 RepID=A0ABU9VEL2_9BACI
MSKNQEHQEKIQRRCLDVIKDNISEKDCFGLSNSHYSEFKRWLSEAKPNVETNKFPDFVISDGFIEHFEVTSSLENKSGSEQKRKSSIFKENSKKDFLSKLNNSEDETLVSRSYERELEGHSYSNLVKSIKKNFKKHIDSYHKSKTVFEDRIFLIEHTDVNLQTAVLREKEPAEVFNSYKISTDKEMLEWVYRYKEKLDYLIFVNPFVLSIEVIRVKNIPEFKDRIPKSRYESTIAIEAHEFMNLKIFN